ncbi:MAG: hypothetical protein GX765_04630, partial [Candidatus Moranbacteria bacterium]|nr:hypothetical protein [Candidatus Moranbacteria bacterium]
EAHDVDSDYRIENKRDFDKNDTKIDEDSPFDIDPGEREEKSILANFIFSKSVINIQYHGLEQSSYFLNDVPSISIGFSSKSTSSHIETSLSITEL